MDSSGPIFEGLPFGGLPDALRSLERIYSELESAESRFVELSGHSCPRGCGLCCEGFVPDILPVEAAWLAAWLIVHDPAAARRLAELGFVSDQLSLGSCPFYVRDGLHHCRVYGGRPLVCRLFGFSGSRDKDGSPVFALCRYMPYRAGSRVRSWQGKEIEGEFGLAPPQMSDFATRAAAIRPSEQNGRTLLLESVPEALRSIYFLRGIGSVAAEGGQV